MRWPRCRRMNLILSVYTSNNAHEGTIRSHLRLFSSRAREYPAGISRCARIVRAISGQNGRPRFTACFNACEITARDAAVNSVGRLNARALMIRRGRAGHVIANKDRIAPRANALRRYSGQWCDQMAVSGTTDEKIDGYAENASSGRKERGGRQGPGGEKRRNKPWMAITGNDYSRGVFVAEG